jgi:hypothetical protein
MARRQNLGGGGGHITWLARRGFITVVDETPREPQVVSAPVLPLARPSDLDAFLSIIDVPQQEAAYLARRREELAA